MIIEIKNLCKNIKNKTILDNINLTLSDSFIYGFYGKNGSGKTMIFRAISGLITPSQGIIEINGDIVVNSVSQYLNVGALIETPRFWNNYTAFENLKSLSLIRKIINDEDIINTLSRVGLDPNSKEKVKNFSLGMKQKLGIAQAIMEKPDLLILDEPPNALDEESIDNIRKILIEEKNRGAIILIASHNKDDINLLCDKKFKIVKGKIEVNNNEEI